MALEQVPMTFEVSKAILWVIILLSIAVTVTFYVLRSIGLYTLAKRNNVNAPFLAWFPGLWMYTACMLIGENKIFGAKIKNLAIMFAVFFSLSEVLLLFYNFITAFPILAYWLEGGSIYFGSDPQVAGVARYMFMDSIYVLSPGIKYPYSNPQNMMKALNIMAYVYNALDVLNIFILINVYMSLFRKFWPQHYLLATLLSLINIVGPFVGIMVPISLFAPFVFAIRKKPAVDYASYARSRYQAYGNPYANPYEQNQNTQSQNTQNPFEDFDNKTNNKSDNKDDEPFSEIFNKKDNQNGDK